MSSATSENGTCEATTPTTERKKKQGGRCGQRNYTEKDIHALLNVADKHVPIEKNDWSWLTAKYKKDTKENTCPTSGLKKLRA